MLKKPRFLAVNSSISGGAGSKLQSETSTVSFGLPVWYPKMVVHCRILQVTVSRSIKPVITSELHRKMKYEEKVHVFLTKADIFTYLVNANVPKPLKNLCTQIRCSNVEIWPCTVEENWHTSGDSDIATYSNLL